ncbi:MAG: twin-arginine translocation signal domain-containing protein, partial [Desulfobacterales bacterium]
MPSDEYKNHKSNRRDFLKKAAAIGLGAAVGGTAFPGPRPASA